MNKIVDFIGNFIAVILFIAGIVLISIGFSMKVIEYKLKDDKAKIMVLEKKIDNIENYLKTLSPDSLFSKEWMLFKMALIDIESKHNPNAINPYSGAAGIFQILPIYIAEANRIQNEIVFTDSCKWNPEMANMIFESINLYWNPEKDFNKALKLHNPVAGQWYTDRVMDRYKYYLSISNQL